MPDDPLDLPRLRGLARPVTPETMWHLARLVGLLASAAAVGLFCLTVPTGIAAHPALLITVAAVALAIGGFLLLVGLRRTAMIRHFGLLVYLLVLVAPGLISLAQFGIGPTTSIAVVVYVEMPIFAFYLLPRRVAITGVVLAAIEFGVVLLSQRGYPVAFGQWAFLAGTLGFVGAIYGGLLARAVDETVRLNRLRRFLSPQVAEGLLAASPAMTSPHRARIAVFFCDLRGFTAFAAKAEPEEVTSLLDSYYKAVGVLLATASATIGSYSGDGIMAYFNDPVPHPDPAAAVVKLAFDSRAAVDAVLNEWRDHGHDLGVGIGAAYGYATLGVVGFEGRYDYTPLGSVVNLASRLCEAARNGQILVDDHIRGELQGRLVGERQAMRLKGFADEVLAYDIERWAGERDDIEAQTVASAET